MKKTLVVAIGTKVQSGAFGGGNQFAAYLTQWLKQHDHHVVFNLDRPDIDVTILTEPRWWSASCAFDAFSAIKYRQRHHSNRLIHRLNECDERKGRKPGLHNLLLQTTAQAADQAIFVSDWLQSLHQLQAPGLSGQVIRSGADPNIFNPQGASIWDGQSTLKIVTHHWSNNWHKGWDVYQKIDELLGGSLRDKVVFTFIGNPWPKANLKHIKILPAISGKSLAAELKRHHVYISASINEPAGMHFIEARQCGLPILFRNSGSLPEYCRGLGIIFKGPDDIEEALVSLIQQYLYYRKATLGVNHNADSMCQAYEEMMLKILTNKPTSKPGSLLYIRALELALFLKNSLL